MTPARFGFVGLGNMGAAMAANLARAGYRLAVYDRAGTKERAPAGTTPADSVGEVAAVAGTVFLSLPDGRASLAVAGEIAATEGRATTVVVDLSTIGVEAARTADALLAAAGIAYADAPVSGGRAGALAGTITVMWGGPADLLEAHRPALQAIAGAIFHVGERPGQGQAMKLLNNFLSATALAATSEAVVFGLSHGLDMRTMLDVLNVSSGRNTATSDKFPNRVLTGTYDAGFATALMSKDLQLYMDGVAAGGTPAQIAGAVQHTWRQAHDAMPGSDFSEIYRFLRRAAGGAAEVRP